MILAHTFPVSQCVRDVAFNQDIRALVALEGVDPDFLLLWAEWASRWFLRRTAESSHGTKKLDMQVLRDARIPVPAKPVQRSLVDVHSTLREGMSAAASHLAQLRDLKTAFLDELFGAPD
jgi:type I restriction enzyme S subunit